jgi:hypothetical protein
VTAGLRAAAVLLLRSAEAARVAAAAVQYGCRDCPHLDVSHDLRADGTRGACSVHTGPKGTPCGCAAFVPILPPE